VAQAQFTDRIEQLERVTALMLNGQNLILVAPRRYGKTSLLMRAVEAAAAAGGRTGRVSLIKCSSENDVVETLMQGVVSGPLGWVRGRATEFTQWLKRIRVAPELSIDPSTGMVHGVSLGPSLAASDWRTVLDQVIRILADLAAADSSHPVSLVIDEFQKAYEISPLIADIFKGLVDDLPGVSLVFAGSKRHVMEAMVNDPDSGALYNVGAKMYLGKVARDHFVPFLRERAAAAGKPMQEAAAQRIYDAAAGVPNDVQLIAFWAFALSATRIDETMVDVAVDAAVNDQREEFTTVFDRLTLVQQRLLKLLATGPVTAVTGRAAQATLQTSHRGALDAALALERAQLVERSGNSWTIANGLLGEWLRGRYD
jgi:uncharacterized protein